MKSRRNTKPFMFIVIVYVVCLTLSVKFFFEMVEMCIKVLSTVLIRVLKEWTWVYFIASTRLSDSRHHISCK